MFQYLEKYIFLFILLAGFTPTHSFSSEVYDSKIYSALTKTEDSALRLEALRFMMADDIVRALIADDIKKIADETKNRRNAINLDGRLTLILASSSAITFATAIYLAAAAGSQKIGERMVDSLDRGSAHLECRSVIRDLAQYLPFLGITSVGSAIAAGISSNINRKNLSSGAYDKTYLLTENSAEYHERVNQMLALIAVALGWNKKDQIDPNAFGKFAQHMESDLLKRAKIEDGEQVSKQIEGIDLLYTLRKTNLWSAFESDSMNFQRARRLIEMGKKTSDLLNLTEKPSQSKRNILAGLATFDAALRESKAELENYLHAQAPDSSGSTKAAISVVEDYLTSVKRLEEKYGK